MAPTISLKSHPLHDFSLPVLKWSTENHTIDYRSCRLAESTHKSPLRDSVLCSTASPFKNEPVAEKEKTTNDPVSRCAKIGFSVPSCPPSDVLIAKSENISTVHNLMAQNPEEKPAALEGRAKIMLRIRRRSTKADDVATDTRNQIPVAVAAAAKGEESKARNWNLRPKKLSSKKLKANGGAPEVLGPSLQGIKPQSIESPIQPEPTLRGTVSEPSKLTGNKKDKKRSFSISLSKEEIEDDIFAMTGSKPTKRPKKRAKNVQRQLDHVFPGLWLDSITADSYRVRNKSTKFLSGR